VSRKRYDEEFKRNAVELLLSGVQDLKPLARDLGVWPATLREWRDRYLGAVGDPPEGPPKGSGPREIAEELRSLRKENEKLRRQREILKKALGILSEQPPGGMP
jgi:transposase